MRWPVPLVLALALAGCAAGEDDGYVGDERFSASEREAIEEGNAWLATKTGVSPVTIRWGSVSGLRRHVIERRDLPEGEIGSSSPANGSIWLDAEQGADRLGPDFAHELAHVLGYVHHHEAGLMNPIVPTAYVWTSVDASSLR